MSGPRVAALGICLLALATSIYRAATQSITIDEAATYVDFVSTGWHTFFHSYDPNNHPLYTLLAKVTTGIFGPSEFTLRMPALAGAVVFLWSLWSLLKSAHGPDSWWTVLGVTVIALNPYVLDYFVAARGYGMACGFLLASINAALERRLIWAGIAAGLAAGTNLAFVFPMAGLSGALLFSKRPWLAFTALWIGIGGALEFGPVRNANPSQFYFKVDSLREMAESLVRVSLFYSNQGYSTLRETVGAAIFWITLLAAIWQGWRLRLDTPLHALTRFLAMMGSFSLCALIAAKYLAGTGYPLLRTAVYWIPVWSLLMLACARLWFPRSRIPAALLAVLILVFLSRWNVVYFHEWMYCAETREIAQKIAAERSHGREVTVGASWPLVSSLRFYRLIHGWTWMREPTRTKPPSEGNWDFYVLMENDRDLIHSRQLRTLLEGSISKAVLATPTKSARD